MKGGTVVQTDKLIDAYGNHVGYAVTVHFPPQKKVDLLVDEVVEVKSDGRSK